MATAGGMAAALGAHMVTTRAGTVVPGRRPRRGNTAGVRAGVATAAIAIAVVTRPAAGDPTGVAVETVASGPGVAAADTQAAVADIRAAVAAGPPAVAEGVVDTPAAVVAATPVVGVEATPAAVDRMVAAHITKHP